MVNGTLPGPLIRLREGQRVRLAVTNGLDEQSFDPLARAAGAVPDGRRAGRQLSRHRAGRDLHL